MIDFTLLKVKSKRYGHAPAQSHAWTTSGHERKAEITTVITTRLLLNALARPK